jgi:hypothetical protein
VAERWTRVSDQPPPERVLVETISPGGMQQTLVRHGRLWFVDERLSMYVYYEPHYWRPITADCPA